MRHGPNAITLRLCGTTSWLLQWWKCAMDRTWPVHCVAAIVCNYICAQTALKQRRPHWKLLMSRVNCRTLCNISLTDKRIKNYKGSCVYHVCYLFVSLFDIFNNIFLNIWNYFFILFFCWWFNYLNFFNFIRNNCIINNCDFRRRMIDLIFWNIFIDMILKYIRY